MLEKEEEAASKKAKKAVMDWIPTSSPIKLAESSMKDSQKSGPKELDAKLASYFYINAIAFNTAASSSFALMIEESVLSQVISSSSCERNWSVHWHVQTKIHSKLSPETTEKLVCVYLNSKMAATACDADKLKMFAWDNEDV